MADNSKFILHWEIDKAAARLATGKAESEVFDQGGFRWTAAVERRGRPEKGKIHFSLRCDSGNNQNWKCEANVAVHVLHSSGTFVRWTEDTFIFNDDESMWQYRTRFGWHWLTNSLTYYINDKVTVAFHIDIITSERGAPIADPGKFAVPNRMSNVILAVGGNKLHVSKELLAVHSPVFETLFFGDFAEKGKEEVEIKDVEYQEFIDLLNLIYARTMGITDHTVKHILQLADQFQMEDILEQSKIYLAQSKGIDAVTKLRIADQYGFVALRDLCLMNFTSVKEVKHKLMSSRESANFSGDMKIAIYDRISELSLYMIEDSNIVLRWEIGNAAASLLTGKAESGVFNEGGFRWAAAVERSSTGQVEFSVQCDVDHNGPWKCEAEVEITVDHYLGARVGWGQDNFCFNNNSDKLRFDSSLWLYADLLAYYIIDDKATVNFHVKIISAERSVPGKFAAPNRMSNVILMIEEKKLHVSKEYLAVHSPVFETLFFGDFAEKGKEEIEIKDVVYEEFIDLLNLIYFRTREITDRTLVHIMKLADQFQMEEVFDQSKIYLTQSKGIDVVTKLILADQYRIFPLRDICLNSFASVHDLTRTIKSSPEYANFSEGMKSSIYDRIMELTVMN